MINGLRALKFWTEYRQRGGELVEVDMIEYCQVGEAQRATNVTEVNRIRNWRQFTDPNNEVACVQAKNRADTLLPLADAWKAGNEAPTNGTPLAAWSGVSPAQAEVLRGAGIKTVEEVAEMVDSVRTRIALPGMVTLQQQAKLFLENRENSKVAAQMAEKDMMIANLREEQEEMKRILIEMQAESQKPRRGRPPKVRDDDDTEEAAA